jgi:hypothetical protein
MTAAGTVAAPVHRAPSRPGAIVRAVRLLGGVIFVASLCMGAYAAFLWLRTGATGSALLADVVAPRLPAEARAWLREPGSWFGLHRFAVWVVRIPVFAASGFVGFLLLLATGTGRRG